MKFLSLALLAILVSLSPMAVEARANPEQNHPDYWGEQCYKTEIEGEIMTFTPSDSNIDKVIIKGGPGNVVYETGPFVDLTAPENDKNGKNYAISHVIVCLADIEDPEDPEDPQDPPEEEDPKEEDPQVEGSNTGKGLPATLPAAGASNIVTTLAGLGTIFGSTWTWIVTRKLTA
ncbi:MAG: hypothetical protein R3313_04070 [Candidatus Saccharimonadales bacterium]|nr:hypothetical protein [Candidatus Saccharimonadales bacterium]